MPKSGLKTDTVLTVIRGGGVNGPQQIKIIISLEPIVLLILNQALNIQLSSNQAVNLSLSVVQGYI